MPRCPWVRNELAAVYHDEEWGVPTHDDRTLFEFLILEGAQAGLSWDTILAKRDNYRRVFHGFDIARVARMTDAAIERILADASSGVVRNRLKLFAARTNARAALEAIDAFGSLDACLWRHVCGAPITNRRRALADVPAETEQARAMSKDLKARGFTFVGPTICYAFMQAVGMVNDHLVTCPRHAALAGAGAQVALTPPTATRGSPPPREAPSPRARSRSAAARASRRSRHPRRPSP